MTKRLKLLHGECQHCQGLIPFSADQVGTVGTCPLCGQPTELMLAIPTEESAIPRRVIVWSVVGIIVLLLILAMSLVALNRAQHWAERQKGPSASTQSPAPTKR
jgi:hypothetical protein